VTTTLVGMDGAGYVVIAISFGLATGIVGRSKGSSFLIWFAVGAVIPLFGLIAAFLFRNEGTEPERQCPNCGKPLKLYVQVCPRCGTDLYLPGEDEPVRDPGATSTRS
jgi:zinc-ribbon domain